MILWDANFSVMSMSCVFFLFGALKPQCTDNKLQLNLGFGLSLFFPQTIPWWFLFEGLLNSVHNCTRMRTRYFLKCVVIWCLGNILFFFFFDIFCV